MDAKVTSEIWSNLGFDAADRDGKLAAFWLITNERVNVLGYAELNERRFAFETQLPAEAVTKGFEALGDGVVRVGKGYWLRNYIGRQIGRGASLARNNFGKAAVKLLVSGCDQEVAKYVLEEYPELKTVEGYATPSKGLRASRKHKRGEERRGEEQQGAEQSGDSAPASRLLTLNQIFNRRESTAWTDDELKAFRKAGLDRMSDEQFAADAGAVIAFYAATIPAAYERKFWRRTELVRVLRHWPSEVDRAYGWADVAQKMASVRGEGRL